MCSIQCSVTSELYKVRVDAFTTVGQYILILSQLEEGRGGPCFLFLQIFVSEAKHAKQCALLVNMSYICCISRYWHVFST